MQTTVTSNSAVTNSTVHRRGLAITAVGFVLVAAAWIVPANGDVVWGGVAAAAGFTLAVSAVVFGWLTRRWLRVEQKGLARRTLALSLVGTITVPLLWLEGEPYPLLAGAIGMALVARRDGSRLATAAVVIGMIGLACTTLLAVLGIFDVLPEWPPGNWHGGGGE